MPVTKTLPSPAAPSAIAPFATIPEHDPLPVIPEDGRDSALPPSQGYVRMYRGRPVE